MLCWNLKIKITIQQSFLSRSQIPHSQQTHDILPGLWWPSPQTIWTGTGCKGRHSASDRLLPHRMKNQVIGGFYSGNIYWNVVCNSNETWQSVPANCASPDVLYMWHTLSPLGGATFPTVPSQLPCYCHSGAAFVPPHSADTIIPNRADDLDW